MFLVSTVRISLQLTSNFMLRVLVRSIALATGIDEPSVILILHSDASLRVHID